MGSTLNKRPSNLPYDPKGGGGGLPNPPDPPNRGEDEVSTNLNGPNGHDLLDARKSLRKMALMQKKLKALEMKINTFKEDVQDFPRPTLDSSRLLENYDRETSKIEAELSAFIEDN